MLNIQQALEIEKQVREDRANGRARDDNHHHDWMAYITQALALASTGHPHLCDVEAFRTSMVRIAALAEAGILWADQRLALAGQHQQQQQPPKEGSSGPH